MAEEITGRAELLHIDPLRFDTFGVTLHRISAELISSSEFLVAILTRCVPSVPDVKSLVLGGFGKEITNWPK